MSLSSGLGTWEAMAVVSRSWAGSGLGTKGGNGQVLIENLQRQWSGDQGRQWSGLDQEPAEVVVWGPGELHTYSQSQLMVIKVFYKSKNNKLHVDTLCIQLHMYSPCNAHMRRPHHQSLNLLDLMTVLTTTPITELTGLNDCTDHTHNR